MSLFKEIYGLLKDTEEGERLGIDRETIRKLVDEDVIPRRYSKGPGVGYPSKEEEEEALGLDNETDEVSVGSDEDVNIGPEDTDAYGDEDSIGDEEYEPDTENTETNLPEQIISYARELMDQGQSAEEAARAASDMIYDELLAELQSGEEECTDCGEDEYNADEYSDEDEYDAEDEYNSSNNERQPSIGM